IDRDTYEHRVLVWEVATETVVHELKLHTKRILAIAFSPDGRFLATAGLDRSVRIWEVATGKPVHTFVGHRGPVAALRYSPDGAVLASGGFDRTVLVWKAAARSQSSLPKGPLTEAEAANLWEELASATPSKAYRAIGRIAEADAPAMKTLRKRVRAVLVPSQNERIKELLVQLDDDDSRVRHRAMRELRKLRKIALPILIKTIKETTSAEVRYRLRRVLEGPEGEERFSPSDIRRMLRIVHAVGRVGGEDAEAILELIVRNLATAPRVVKEATETLQRLRQTRSR
ncbi:MAG: WD40 repeat domain-containing protein, partial [Planctomycetaceae bacterium]